MLTFNQALMKTIDDYIWSPVALNLSEAGSFQLGSIQPYTAKWRIGAQLILAVAAERTRGLLSIITERV